MVKDGVPFSNVRANVAFNLDNKVCFSFQFDGVSAHLRAKVMVFGSSLRKLDKGQCLDKSV